MKKTMIRVAFLVFLALGLTPTTAWAIAPQLSQAIDQIFNANFSQAKTTIDGYIAGNSQDPAGYLARGMLMEWDQVVNNKRNALNGAIMAEYQKANQLAQTAFDADPNNIDKMVILGNTYMYMAKKQVDSGQKMKGGGTLKKAKELMLTVIEKDPGNNDAYFALGVFNYFSANVPSGFKWLAILLGFNGNKSDGLKYIKQAAENKNLTQGDAAFLLVYIYAQKERNYSAALTYNGILKSRYPNNPAFQYEDGEIYYRQKNYTAARSSYDTFLAFCANKPQGFCNNKYTFSAHYFTTASYIEEKNDAMAKKHIDMAIKLNTLQYKDRNVFLDLWSGILAKNSGDKAKADDFFKKVESNQKDSKEAWKLAQQEMTTPSQ